MVVRALAGVTCGPGCSLTNSINIDASSVTLARVNRRRVNSVVVYVVVYLWGYQIKDKPAVFR